VLEMGGYYNEADFNQLELWAYENLYHGGALHPTNDGQIVIMAGQNLGGGTTVNWTNCLRTRPWVREEWAREHGLEDLDGPEFDRHLDAVLERISGNDRCSDWNGPHQRLKEACEKVGIDFDTIVRNTDEATYSPDNAGFIGYGDQSGSKQGTLKTYLQDASDAGAQFVVNCRVERVLTEDGHAAGVEGSYADADGHRAHIVVRAPQIVLAGGSWRRRRSSCARALAGPPPASTCACTRGRPSSGSTTSRRRAGGARRRPGSRTSSSGSRATTAS